MTQLYCFLLFIEQWLPEQEWISLTLWLLSPRNGGRDGANRLIQGRWSLIKSGGGGGVFFKK